MQSIKGSKVRRVAKVQHTMVLANHPCTARVDGHICGSVWLDLTFKGQRKVSTRCYMCHVQRKGARARRSA